MPDKDKSIERTLNQEMDEYEEYKAKRGAEIASLELPGIWRLSVEALPMVEDFLKVVSKDRWGRESLKHGKPDRTKYQACLELKWKNSALVHYFMNKNKYPLVTMEILKDNELYNLTARHKPRDFRVKFLSKIIKHNLPIMTCPPIWKLRKIIQLLS